jgi:hypothetical protein
MTQRYFVERGRNLDRGIPPFRLRNGQVLSTCSLNGTLKASGRWFDIAYEMLYWHIAPPPPSQKKNIIADEKNKYARTLSIAPSLDRHGKTKATLSATKGKTGL